MLIFASNQNHRYHLTNVQDTPIDTKQKSGMAGYSRCLGWLLEKLHIAVCFHDGDSKFYLNRRSAIKYINRHRDDPLDKQAKAKKICQELFALATATHTQPERPITPKARVQEPVAVPTQNEVLPSVVENPPAPTIEVLPIATISAREELPQVTLHTEPVVLPEPALQTVHPEPNELQFPYALATDEVVAAWCDQATPEQLLENFGDLYKIFKDVKSRGVLSPKPSKLSANVARLRIKHSIR